MFFTGISRQIARCRKLVLVVLLTVFGLETTFAALPPAAEWIPKNAVISLELSKPKALLDMLTGKEATAALNALPAYKSLMSSPKSQELLTMLGFVESTLGTDWRTGLAKITGGGITFAICPEDIFLLIIDAEDEAMLTKIHDLFLNIARNDGQGGELTSIEGVTAWTFNGKEAHTIIGKRFVLASSAEGLKKVLDLRDKGAGEKLTSKASYQAARQAAGPDSAATAFADLSLLKYIPDISALLEASGSNPLSALVFAGIVDALRDSSWLGLGLDVEQSTLVLRASVDGKAGDSTSSARFALPKKAGQGALPNLSVPRRLASMSLYRDLHEFYAAKDDLFPERTSGLIFFENMMGIFFSGRDLTNEVLAQAEPEIRLVVAEQEYDTAIGIPQVKLPAFAVIFRVKDPDEFDIVAEEAWQKAVGLINFTRGQQAMPGLIIDRPTQGDTKFTVAYFSTVDLEGKTDLDQRFNFRPSVAMPGDYLIFSSTDGLARDLVDALDREMKSSPDALAGTHSALEIDAEQVASILEANRMTLVRGDMVKKGKTQAESEAGIDLMIAVIKFAKQLKLSVGTGKDLAQAKLELNLNF